MGRGGRQAGWCAWRPNLGIRTGTCGDEGEAGSGVRGGAGGRWGALSAVYVPPSTWAKIDPSECRCCSSHGVIGARAARVDWAWVSGVGEGGRGGGTARVR